MPGDTGTRLADSRGMKSKLFVLGLVFLGALAGCGGEQAPGNAFQLQLLMPKTLTRNEARYRKFLERTQYLKIRFDCASGEDVETLFAPQDWAQMSVPTLGVPEDEKIKIVAEIWDRTSQGTPRAYPVVRGELVVDGKKLNGEVSSVLTVPMSLRVAVTEYD